MESTVTWSCAVWTSWM